MHIPKISYFEAIHNVIQQYTNDHPDSPKLPYSDGMLNAYRCYEDSILTESSELECSVLPDLEHLDDFVNALRDAGVECIAITATDVSLLPSLARMLELGCTPIDPCKVEQRREGSDERFVIPGLRLWV